MNFKKLTYLCMQRLTNFPYIEADFDALTNYELLCKVVEYLNKVIANENNQNEAIQELSTSLIELKNYVDNLDLQDEVNNKLDEMYENGQLADLVAQYLGLAGLITFDTVADMKEALNLINGSKCKTLGYHSVNDGGGAFYKVRTITNDDVVDEASIIELADNTLIAEFINDDKGFINVNKFGLTNNLYMNDYWSVIYNYALANNLYIYFPTGTYKVEKRESENNYIFTGNFISMKGENATILCESSVNNTTDLFRFTGVPNGFNQFIKGIKFDTETNNYTEVRHFLHFIFSDLHLFYNLQIENNVFMKSSNYAIYTPGNATTGGFNNCKFNNNIVYGLFIKSDSYGDSNKINGNSLFASESVQLGDYPIKLIQTAGSHNCEVCSNNCSGGLGSFDSFFDLLIEGNQIENVHQNLAYLINLIGSGANINIDNNNLNAHDNSDIIYTRIVNTIIQNCTIYAEKDYVVNSYAHITKFFNNRWFNGTSYLTNLTDDKVVGEVTNCIYTKTDRKYFIDNELNMHIKPLVTSSIQLLPYQAESDNTYPYSQPIEYDNNTIKTLYHNNKDYVRTDVLLNSYAIFKIQDF